MFTIFLLSAVPVMFLQFVWEIHHAPAGYEDEQGFHVVKRPADRMQAGHHHHHHRCRAGRGCARGKSMDRQHTARASIMNRIHGHRGVSPFFHLRPPLQPRQPRHDPRLG